MTIFHAVMLHFEMEWSCLINCWEPATALRKSYQFTSHTRVIVSQQTFHVKFYFCIGNRENCHSNLLQNSFKILKKPFSKLQRSTLALFDLGCLLSTWHLAYLSSKAWHFISNLFLEITEAQRPDFSCFIFQTPTFTFQSAICFNIWLIETPD